MRRKLCWGIVGLSLSAIAAGVEAQPAELEKYSQTYERCMEQSGGVTVNMIDCLAAENARLDQKLNAAYTSVMAGMHPPSTKSLLRDAQRAWISFRDKACMAEGEITAQGGTLGGVARASCALEITAQRTAALGRLAALPENVGAQQSTTEQPAAADRSPPASRTQGVAQLQPTLPEQSARAQNVLPANAELQLRLGVMDDLTVGRLLECMQNGVHPNDRSVPRQVMVQQTDRSSYYLIRTTLNSNLIQLDLRDLDGSKQVFYVERIRAGSEVIEQYEQKSINMFYLMRPCLSGPGYPGQGGTNRPPRSRM